MNNNGPCRKYVDVDQELALKIMINDWTWKTNIMQAEGYLRKVQAEIYLG